MGSVTKRLRKTGYSHPQWHGDLLFDRPKRNGRRHWDQIERLVEGLKALHRTAG